MFLFHRNLIPASAFFGVELKVQRTYTSIENPQNIGEHIRRRRLVLRLFQSDVAKILDVSEDTITYWENGRSNPQIQFCPGIIRFLGYNPFAPVSESIGGKIYRYRAEKGLSKEKFAEILGVNESTIWAWEVEKQVPLPSKLRLLEKILNSKEP